MTGAIYSARVSSQAIPHSPSRRALRIHVERIKRMARRHEQPVAFDAAEADIGGALGQCDEPDGFAGRVENLHAVLLRAAHARSEEHTSELQSLRHLVCRLLL